MKFKIGQQVRLYCPNNFPDHHLRTGTIESHYSDFASYVKLNDYTVLIPNGYLQPIYADGGYVEPKGYIVSGSAPKPRKEWTPDEISPDIDVMDVTRGLLG